jgi:RNA polymerase sigma factor (sigma-70 family)
MRAGRDQAWSEFHRRYYLLLLRHALARTARAADAPEIVQQSYLRIARHIKVLNDENDFCRWLACIVRCAAMDHARGLARRAVLLEKFSHWRAAQCLPWPADSPWDGSLAREALEKLPANDAEMLRLKYYDGWSVQQLANAANTTPKTMENRLSRARQKLREIILRIQ